MDHKGRGSAERRQLEVATRGLLILALFMIVVLLIVQVLLAEGYL